MTNTGATTMAWYAIWDQATERCVAPRVQFAEQVDGLRRLAERLGGCEVVQLCREHVAQLGRKGRCVGCGWVSDAQRARDEERRQKNNREFFKAHPELGIGTPRPSSHVPPPTSPF